MIEEQRIVETNSYAYTKIHLWLRKEFGNAVECEHCKVSDKKRYEWALRKGFQYDFKRENFIQLCTSCHRKYDYTEDFAKKCSDAKKGIPSNRSHQIEIKNRKTKEISIYPSIRHAARESEFSYFALAKAIKEDFGQLKNDFICRILPKN